MEKHYMGLPYDMAGSISKNRFRIELLWGISKMIECHKEGVDYTIIFDFKCDVEVHKKQGLEFYQIKTILNRIATLQILYVR